ncbi:MAG TPA: hypothetical protein VEX86_19960, partial [Longimicrobium sp.]|nr:hypothetical protein [Longimicrobium sp.]
GVLLFLLLMEGTHPFATRMAPGEDALPVEERIRRGHFPHARLDDDCHPPRMSPRFDALHPGLRALFVRCFVAGHADPAARPTAAEWRDALEAVEQALDACAVNPQHRYHADLGACPWCERAAALGGRDPFPAGAVNAPVDTGPRARRVRLAHPFAAAPNGPVMAAPRFGVRPAAGGVAVPPGAIRPGALNISPTVPPAAVFGPSGVRNPLVFALSGLTAMAAGHGAIPVLGFVMLMVAGWMLTLGEWRHIRAITVLLAFYASVCVGVVVRMGADDDAAGSHRSVLRDLGSDDGSSPGLPLPGGVEVVPEPEAPPEVVPAATERGMMDVRVADLHSEPFTNASFDPGPLPHYVAPQPGVLADGTDVDRLPVVDNPREVAQALAVFYRNEVPRQASGDSAMLWLHVGADGQVTPGGHHFIRAGSLAASRAADAAVPYLRYRPATRDGRPVGVWITQRMVFVP